LENIYTSDTGLVGDHWRLDANSLEHLDLMQIQL